MLDNPCLRALLWVLGLVSPTLCRLRKRLTASPGIPVDDPCPSYWMSPPSRIAKHGSDATVPTYADVVIIGSGITGTSVARAILDEETVVVVMLEARDTCSGATGRNGGHITPVLYQDYSELKKKHGAEVAGEIVRFRLSHLDELLAVASEENLLEESQCRETRAYDVYQNPSLYRNAKKLLEVFKRDLPVEGSDMEIVEDRAVLQELQLAPSVVGDTGEAIEKISFEISSADAYAVYEY
ncbi:hypothetical protein Agabi119p4_968 [Agaricus bisporus var. burnettii]|uniref:FAD dependent oxidoreductase domain-containing protein n=1 Tax=Agaricus bisporus var. burnettii TaxID=192524 RepID=A0A8H7FC31_AGABI|nr:hypothetical protein Agabi119p4_968 [Agaricus bisporus var. burnettii]